MRIFPAFVLFLFCGVLNAYGQMPAVKVLSRGTNSSLRGLSVVNDSIIWTCGSRGTVGKSLDRGKTWKWMIMKGFDGRDFRDIEAFGPSTAVILVVDAPAYIMKTTDGGDSWNVVYENDTEGMFLDAMEFRNQQDGIAVGDPVNGRFFLVVTTDGGNTWQESAPLNCPVAEKGEGCFAASGTNIRAFENDWVFVSGGITSRIFIGYDAAILPVVQGTESTGANSVAVFAQGKPEPRTKMIVVGGDFSNDTVTTRNCFYTEDRGATWQTPRISPHGYRSCVEFLSEKEVITCGLNGVDYSNDGGITYEWISKESFHVARRAKSGSAVYLAGPEGKIGVVER